MEEIIIDIGSGNIKAYSINKNKEIKNIYLKNIMLKKNFSKENGISEKDKKELISAIKEIKDNNIGIPVYAYATSIFRMLDKEKLYEIQKAIGIKINVISQQEEEKYMAKAVGNLNMINGIVEQLYEEKLIKKLWNYMKINQKLEKSDCIIGLGCEDLNIAKIAADLYIKGYGNKIIFTGGLGKVTKNIWNEPEANKFAKYAIENGVPKEKIYIENKSTNTGDNFRFTKELIKQEKLDVKSCIVVCKPYVEKRILATINKIIPECKVIVTSQDIDFEQYCNQYEKEIGDRNEVIEDLVGSVERMKIFAKRGWQAEMDIPDDVWQVYEELVKRGYDKYCTKKHKEM